MTILADTEHGKVWRIGREQFAVSFAFSRSISRLASQSVKFGQRHFADQTIDQKTPERLWARDSSIPRYSSRWKPTTRDQSMPGVSTSAARNSFCDGADANMPTALPRDSN